jgi:NAD(P)H-dependent FMN reductase
MKLLAISGSLRSASINSALLRALSRLAPSDIEIDLFAGLGELPLFNPDLEVAPPSSVQQFRLRVAASDALIIASPEYAHGVTGAIKNGLDWLVSYEPFAYKFVAVLNSSPRAHHADAALRETLKTMSAVIVESASITIPLLGSDLDENDMVATPSVANTIRELLVILHKTIQSDRRNVTPLQC